MHSFSLSLSLSLSLSHPLYSFLDYFIALVRVLVTSHESYRKKLVRNSRVARSEHLFKEDEKEREGRGRSKVSERIDEGAVIEDR